MYLFDDKDDVVNLLTHQHWMQVAEEGQQMGGSISKGHHNGHSVLGPTVRRTEMAARLNFGQ